MGSKPTQFYMRLIYFGPPALISTTRSRFPLYDLENIEVLNKNGWQQLREYSRHTQGTIQQWLQYVISLQYVCFGKEMLIISLSWQCSISAHLFHLAPVHQPGVPHFFVPMIQQTKTLSDAPATVLKVTQSAASIRGGQRGCLARCLVVTANVDRRMDRLTAWFLIDI